MTVLLRQLRTDEPPRDVRHRRAMKQSSGGPCPPFTTWIVVPLVFTFETVKPGRNLLVSPGC